MLIRPAQTSDLSQVASLHKQCFGAELFGQYSVSLMSRYYRCLLGRCVLLVAVEKTVVGFIVGGPALNISRAREDFIRNHLLLYVVETTLHPRIYLAAFKRALRMLAARRREKKDPPTYAADRAHVLLIAVSPAAQGVGVGSRLLQAFEDAIYPTQVYALTVQKENNDAVRFYLKSGFVVEVQWADSMRLVKTVQRDPQPHLPKASLD